MIVAERGSGRMTYAKKPFAEQDLRVTLQRAGNKRFYMKCSVPENVHTHPQHYSKEYPFQGVIKRPLPLRISNV